MIFSLIYLLPAVLAQNICTHADYGDFSSDTNCYTAAVCSGTSTSGTPTFFGSVENEKDAKVKFQKNGGCPNIAPISPCSLDEITLTGIQSIQPGRIGICENEFLSASKGDANENAEEVFKLVSGVLTLNKKVDMKNMGGPRHIIRLLTNTGCIVHAQIMILPKTSATADISYEVSDVKVLDEMYAPGLSYFQDTGVKLEFIVTFHDNIQCAIDFYEDDGDMTKKENPMIKFGDIGIEVDGNSVGSAKQSWIECVSDNCWSFARRGRMEELDLNKGISWTPGSGGCKVKVHFDQFGGSIPAITYQDQQSVTYNFNLNEAGSIGFKPSKYSGQSLTNVIDIANEIRLIGTSNEQVIVQDIDNMPPLFCSIEDSTNCPAESYHSAIQTTIDDCQSAQPLFTLPNVIDGDIGIEGVLISITTKTFDSEGNDATDAFDISSDGKIIERCNAAEDSSTYIVEFKAEQDNNENRFSYYYATITIGTTEVEKTGLIKLADGLESITQWRVDFADGNYVTSVCNEDDSSCQSQKLKFEAGSGAEGDTIIMASRTQDFIIDEHTGYVIYTGSPSALSLFAGNPLEIYGFAINDEGKVTGSEIFESEVQIDDIDTDPESSTPGTGTTTSRPDSHVTDPTELDAFFISTICLAVVLGLLIIAIIVYFCCFNNEDDMQNGHDKLVDESSLNTSDSIELKPKEEDSNSLSSTDSASIMDMPRANAPGKAALLGVGGAAAVAHSNQGFVDDEAIKPLPKPAAPMSAPSPVPPSEASIASSKKRAPPPVAKVAVATAVATSVVNKDETQPPQKDSVMQKHTLLNDPLFHTLNDHQIRLESTIKSGSAYSVRKAYIKNQSTGAAHFACARIYHVSSTTQSEQQDILEKIMLDTEVSKIRHDSILQYYGAWIANDSIHLSHEYCGKGRLNEFLVQSRENSWNGVSSLSNYKLLNLITEIAKGLSHLHQRNIIHGNIRAYNIMMTDEGQPKIAAVGHPDVSEDRQRYWSPELFKKHEYTRESDIWAFGVLVWEISSLGGVPYSSVNIQDIENYIRLERLPMPQNCTAELYAFMSQCWKSEPRMRPDIFQIVASMQEKLINNSSATAF